MKERVEKEEKELKALEKNKKSLREELIAKEKLEEKK